MMRKLLLKRPRTDLTLETKKSFMTIFFREISLKSLKLKGDSKF